MILCQFFMKRYPGTFGGLPQYASIISNRDSEIRGAIVRIAKTNTLLKRPVKKFFAVENTHHDTNQTDKARGQKFRL